MNTNIDILKIWIEIASYKIIDSAEDIKFLCDLYKKQPDYSGIIMKCYCLKDMKFSFIEQIFKYFKHFGTKSILECLIKNRIELFNDTDYTILKEKILNEYLNIKNEVIELEKNKNNE